MLEVADMRRDVFDDLRHLLRVGTVRNRGLLRPAQAGRGDHLHRLGDLLDIFDAFNTPPYTL